MISDLIFRRNFSLRKHFQRFKGGMEYSMRKTLDRLTFCDKIVILLNGLLMESLVGIHFKHLTWTVEVPMRHHYGVDDHGIVLMLDAQNGELRRYLVFRRALGPVSLIVALIDDLHGWIRSYYFVQLELNSILIGWKKAIKSKLKIRSTW